MPAVPCDLTPDDSARLFALHAEVVRARDALADARAAVKEARIDHADARASLDRFLAEVADPAGHAPLFADADADAPRGYPAVPGTPLGPPPKAKGRRSRASA